MDMPTLKLPSKLTHPTFREAVHENILEPIQ